MDVDDLTSALVEACKTYTEEVVKKVEDGIADIGKDATDEVKSLAPEYTGADIKRNGKTYHVVNKKLAKGAYRRNWTYRIDRSRGEFKVTVHVKGRKYRLTHLLEYGHLNRDGKTRAREFPHISIAEKHAEEKVNELLENL
ncbi:MAG: hypothetical protein J6Y64_05930 [Ruminococcus sp.]|nr:hypothetical protein [Ruminococcus sp.]